VPSVLTIKEHITLPVLITRLYTMFSLQIKKRQKRTLLPLKEGQHERVVTSSANATHELNPMRIIKCGLNTAVRNDASKQFFKDLVGSVHDVKTAAHLLCKAWILERFRNNEPLPGGHGALASLFENAICAMTGSTSNPQRTRLRALANTLFPPGFQILPLKGMKNWPAQAAASIQTPTTSRVDSTRPRVETLGVYDAAAAVAPPGRAISTPALTSTASFVSILLASRVRSTSPSHRPPRLRLSQAAIASRISIRAHTPRVCLGFLRPISLWSFSGHDTSVQPFAAEGRGTEEHFPQYLYYHPNRSCARPCAFWLPFPGTA
jgi:hypothetical protein